MSKKQRFILFSLLLAFPLMLFVSSSGQDTRGRAQTADVAVTVDLAAPLLKTKLGTGASIIHNNEIAFSAGGKQAIKSSMSYVNAHIMGFGADNPNPAPGKYDWGSLDQSVQLMRDTGATKMITLCCSPDWMKGGTSGQTDWNKIEVAPLASHYKDYAALSKQVAQRYPDVEYFQVWNELKGFWKNEQNRWDYEGYTSMYNQVYDSIKSVKPNAKIGGPYSILMMEDKKYQDVITYWLKNKKGADFIVVDGGPAPPKTAGEEFTNASVFAQFTTWLRKQPGGETLPFGWAEWYPRTTGGKYDANHFNAIIAHDYIETMLAGATYILMWGVQGDSQGLTGDPGNPEVIMTASGKTTPVYTTMKAFKDFFPAGTQLYKTTTSSKNVTVVASKTKAILVNKLATAQNVTINGKKVTLTGYQVLVITLSGGTASPTVKPTTPIVPTYVCAGSTANICPSSTPTKASTPSKAVSNPTAAEPTGSAIASPIPTVSPCGVNDLSIQTNSHKKKVNGNISSLIEKLLQLISQFFALLNQFFGGNAATPVVENPSPTQSPTQPCATLTPAISTSQPSAPTTIKSSPVPSHKPSPVPSLIPLRSQVQTPAGINGLLKVCGSRLCNQYGKPIQLRGVSSHGLQWLGLNKCLTDGSLDALAKDWKADIVRLAMYVQEGGYETNPAAFRTQVDTLVQKVSDKGMYVIIDWHILTPGNPNVNLARAQDFFTYMAKKHANSPNVIYEIANEPNGVNWQQIKTYADQVIPLIRKYDPDAVIIVGTPDFSSMTPAETILANRIADKNVMYTYHFYAGSHGEGARNNIANLSDKLPIFVTEWGTAWYSGDGANDFTSAQKWVDMMATKKISWANWNFSDNPQSGASYKTGTCPNGPWAGNSLKPSGKFIREKLMTPDNFPTT